MSLMFFAVIGLALGGGYFGHLWLDVSRRLGAGRTRSPAVRVPGGFAVRACILTTAFLLVSQAGGPAIVAALGGVISARLVLTRYLLGGSHAH